VPYVGFAFTDAALDFLDSLPPKIRKQVIKKAKALHIDPFPQGVKKLQGVATLEGDPIYRERSGDYRILYIVREKPAEIIILDIDHRKDVYRMPKTGTDPADDLRMKESDFDSMMQNALGVPAPLGKPKKPGNENAGPKRLSAYPKRPKA